VLYRASGTVVFAVAAQDVPETAIRSWSDAHRPHDTQRWRTRQRPCEPPYVPPPPRPLAGRPRPVLTFADGIARPLWLWQCHLFGPWWTFSWPILIQEWAA
jgi:hypothetical protein